MTNQEAINIIKTAIAQVEWDYPMECAAALDKAIEALGKREALDNGGWVSVKDRLPEKNGRYLVCENGEVYSAEYEKNRPDSEWTDDYEGYLDMMVSHWMPMPEPPKEEA